MRPALRCIRFACAAFASLLIGTTASAADPAPASAPKVLRGAPMTRADADFLKQAAQSGHAEIEAGRIALTKGVNTQVKGFAQQMIDDHGRIASELAALAAAKGIELPHEASVAQKAKIKLLAARDGGSFDRRFAETVGVAAHRDALRLFQKAALGATDPEIKAFAAKAVPMLRLHLERATELKGVVDKEGNAKAPGDRKQ
ncbi:MAG TPA: DUF4142 domain-containing protein [Albitalea sp.]|nr:DUF4142 domain-containing protein [Albitalea sp.]